MSLIRVTGPLINFIYLINSAPGGIILQEGENERSSRTKICLFGLADSMEKVKAFEQVFVKLMRRYVEMFKFIIMIKIFY